MLEAYDSPKSRKLNEQIFETMYYHALKKSIELAKRHGPYSSFEGSPLSKGILHFDNMTKKRNYEYMYDWEAIRRDVKIIWCAEFTLDCTHANRLDESNPWKYRVV